MSDKCICHLNGFAIKDAKARSELENKLEADDIATINGQSITGGGNIIINGSGTIDLSDYPKKSNIASINGQSITEGGNIEIKAGISVEDIATNDDIDSILGGSSYIDELNNQADNIIEQQEELIGVE